MYYVAQLYFMIVILRDIQYSMLVVAQCLQIFLLKHSKESQRLNTFLYYTSCRPVGPQDNNNIRGGKKWTGS